MSERTVPYLTQPGTGPAMPDLSPPDDEGQPRRFSWGVLARSRWLIVACTALVVAITAFITARAVPVYQSSASLRIEEKVPNLPEMFRSVSGDRRLGTEIEELRSRTLAAEVVDDLGLRLSLHEPRVFPRSALLRNVKVADSAAGRVYLLVREANQRLSLRDKRSGQELATFAPGERVEYGGFSFSLGANSAEHPVIQFGVSPRTSAVSQVLGGLSVYQAGRDVNIVRVVFESPDPELAWRVPQFLVDRYMEQRQALQALETKSTIGFLREQIDTISKQLAESEKTLEVFRERYEVINPEAEASGQVGRLVSMQTQRAMLETERNALASLIAEVDAKAARPSPGDPSPYRRLLAFPTLLESQASIGLLQSLTVAEDQRKTLLTRRTEKDPDVIALNERIDELEGELRAIAATYMQGLSNQVNSVTESIEAFRQQLRGIPEKELQYARLERQPKVLGEVMGMLQTRLKEAEISAAAGDPSVRVVDRAPPPSRPIWPRPAMNLLAGFVCGLLLGVGLAFGRAYLDRAIRSRMDVRGATGLPVIGVIPRIAVRRTPVAMIAEPLKRLAVPSQPRPAPGPAPTRPAVPTRRTYTFLQSGSDQPEQTIEAPRAGEPAPVVERTALRIPVTAGVIAEAYGVLQTNIVFSQVDRPVKTLVFTSPLPGDGKTTTVVNLAVSLAQRGLRTLLIDGDLRRGIVHSVFGAAREPGLSDVLHGTMSFESVRRGTWVGDRGVLDYVTSGKLSPTDYGLVTSDAMRELLARAREEYDAVIVDTPPVNIMTDAAVLGASADGVVVIARAGVTEAPALAYAVEQLRRVRARVLGVVLNDIDVRRDSAYDGSYKYFQAYEYSTVDS